MQYEQGYGYGAQQGGGADEYDDQQGVGAEQQGYGYQQDGTLQLMISAG